MTVDNIYRYIDVNPISSNDAVFRTTTISVEHVLADIENGMSSPEILRDHQQITEDRPKAAAVYAREFPSDNQQLLIALSGFLGG